MAFDYDLFVIGGGSGGVRAARVAAATGARVAGHRHAQVIGLQLGAIAGFLYMSICGPTGTGEITAEEFTEQRAIATSGDSAWFVRKMLSMGMHHRDEPEKLKEFFYGTAIRTRHSENFRQTFSKLLLAAKDVDMENMVTNALLYGSPSGMLYRIIQHIRGEEAIDPLNISTPPGTTANLHVEP